MEINTEILDARPVALPPWQQADLWLVGCGGTGSWLAPHLARLAWVLKEEGRDVQLTFCDPDLVERKNIARQHFCPAEIGRNKAATLAARYGAAFGLAIAAVDAAFTPTLPVPRHGTLTILVGCVDNAAGRRALLDALIACNSGYPNGRATAPWGWWVDCGNHLQAGQVLVGNTVIAEDLATAFEPEGMCRLLPSPALQCPDLLTAQPEELADTPLSCAEQALRNAQGLSINQAAASEATDFLLRLLITGDLQKFATYFNRPSGTARSLYTTPGAVAGAVGRPHLFAPPKKAKKEPAASRERDRVLVGAG